MDFGRYMPMLRALFAAEMLFFVAVFFGIEWLVAKTLGLPVALLILAIVVLRLYREWRDDQPQPAVDANTGKPIGQDGVVQQNFHC